MKKRLISLLLSYCFVGSICLFSSNLWAIDIVQITNTPGINERHPRIVMKDSSVYVVWLNEQAKFIYFAKSTNNGKNWSTPLQIWNGAYPSIAISDNGDIYIVWENDGEILFRKSTDGGDSFEPHLRVGRGDACDVAVDSSGNIYIIWTKLKESPPAGKPKPICFSRSTDGGMKFSDPVVVDSTFGTFRYGLRVAVNPSGNNVYVVWAGVPIGGHYVAVWFSKSTDAGAIFGPTISPTSKNAHGEWNPDIEAYGENNVYIVWRNDLSRNNHIYITISTDSGQTWSAVKNFNPQDDKIDDGDYETTDTDRPSITVDKYGYIYVVWTGTRDNYTGWDIYLDKSIDGGQSFGTDVLIDDSFMEKPRSSMAVNNLDNIGIVWDGNRNGNYDIYCAPRIFTTRFNISGTIQYYFNDKPVANTIINLAGNQNSTSTEGMFSFIGIPEGNYTLFPSKDGALWNSISAYDASMILRNVVGSLPLNPYQMIASDVSGNGDVSALDASYILRYVVGLITEFPVGNDWTFVPTSFAIDSTNWAIAPDSLRYEPLNSDTLNQNFIGIIYGDVSGNWTGSTDRGASVITEINIENIQHNNDGRWLIPLEMEFSDEAYSGSFKVLFNNPDLKFASSSIDNSLPNNMLFTSNSFPGGINFAFASAQPLNEQVVKINLLFEEIKPNTPSVSNFEFVDVVVDDKSATVTVVENQSSKQVPFDWHLNQNYPNPFNAETSIGYQVPKSSYVKIEVFNLLAQRLRTLVNEKRNPGTYKAIWNGKDDQGQSVGSGIYIYRMDAAEFTAIKKMVLVQ